MRKRTKRRLIRAATIAVCVLAAVTVAVNGLVRWVSGSGPWLLDPRHLGAKSYALVLYARHRPLCFLTNEGEPLKYVPEAARRHRLDPDLLTAMLRVESGGRAHRISATGACGPAQLLPGTAHDLSVSDPFDPSQAVDGGARYLREQLDRYKENRALALAAYNAGPGAVHGTIPVNGETEVYVPRVLAEYRAIREARRRSAAPARSAQPQAPSPSTSPARSSPSTSSPARRARPKRARAPGTA